MMRLIVTALAVSLATACTALNGPTPLFDANVIGTNSATPLTASSQSVPSGTLISQFYADLQASKAAENSTPLALNAFNSGTAVVNARCQLYFRSLGLDARDLSFATNQLVVIGGALTSILALVNASPTAIASVAAGSAALVSGAQRFGDAYYFSADVASVEQMVTKAQSDAAEKANTAGNVPLNFYAAINFLVSYQSICQPHTIKRLVNEAVTAGTPVTSFQSPSVGRPPATDIMLSQLSATMGLSTAANDVAFAALKAVYDTPSPANFLQICGYLTSFVPGPFFTFPPGSSPVGGAACPKGTTVTPNADMNGKVNNFWTAATGQSPIYWNGLKAQVTTAATVADISSIVPPVKTTGATPGPSGIGADGLPQRGRVGGFTVGIH